MQEMGPGHLLRASDSHRLGPDLSKASEAWSQDTEEPSSTGAPARNLTRLGSTCYRFPGTARPLAYNKTCLLILSGMIGLLWSSSRSSPTANSPSKGSPCVTSREVMPSKLWIILSTSHGTTRDGDSALCHGPRS